MSDDSLWTQLTSRGGLMAIGASLAMFGLLIRGFARQSRREAALRQQHWLHTRKPGEVDPTIQQSSWLDRNASRIANSVTIAGAAIIIAAFFRS